MAVVVGVRPGSFIVGFVWIALIVGVLAVERRRKKLNLPPPVADPTCPKCGYLVMGLPGKVCPECGSDLSSVGVIRRDDTRTSAWGRVVLWTILFALPAFLVWRYVEPRLPLLRDRTVTRSFSGPASNANKSIGFRFIEHQWEWRDRSAIGVPYDRLEFRLKHVNGRESLYVINRRALTAAERIANADRIVATTYPRRAKIFDRDQLLGWMQREGINSDDQQVKDEVEAVSADLDDLSTGRSFFVSAPPFASLMPQVYGGFYGRPLWMTAGCVVVGAVLWLLGVAFLAKRRPLPYERTTLPQAA